MSACTWASGRPVVSTPRPCSPGTARSTAYPTPDLGRSGGVSRTSSSDVFTPSACSSCSARPVRRDTAATSGTSHSSASARPATRLLSSRLVPGPVCTLTVSDPSLNGGRNSDPMPATASTDPYPRTPATTRIARGCRTARRTTRVAAHFSPRSSGGSPFRPRNRARGSSTAARAGVTVSDTASEASSDTM